MGGGGCGIGHVVGLRSSLIESVEFNALRILLMPALDVLSVR